MELKITNPEVEKRKQDNSLTRQLIDTDFETVHRQILRQLPSSVVSSKNIEEFKSLI